MDLLARHLEAFESPSFSFGSWEPARTGDDGVIQLGWYRFSHAGGRFLADVAKGGWVHPFDWRAWLATPRGQELSGDPAAVASASAEELGQLLTAIVRSDRFVDGSIAGAFESGLLTAIVRRASALMESEAGSGSREGA